MSFIFCTFVIPIRQRTKKLKNMNSLEIITIILIVLIAIMMYQILKQKKGAAMNVTLVAFTLTVIAFYTMLFISII